MPPPQQRYRQRRPNQRQKHIRLRIPRSALRAQKLIGALAERQRHAPFDQLVHGAHH